MSVINQELTQNEKVFLLDVLSRRHKSLCDTKPRLADYDVNVSLGSIEAIQLKLNRDIYNPSKYIRVSIDEVGALTANIDHALRHMSRDQQASMQEPTYEQFVAQLRKWQNLLTRPTLTDLKVTVGEPYATVQVRFEDGSLVNIHVDGVIKGAWVHGGNNYQAVGKHITGKIYADRKGRFQDGEVITTSIVQKVIGDCYWTKNSVYKIEMAYDTAPVGKR